MKKIIIGLAVVVIIIIGAWEYFKAPAATEAPETIKIGWATPITGPLASFGEADPWLVQKITSIINDEEGGLYIKEFDKRIPIEILVRDTGSDEMIAASVTEDLIKNEGVYLMMGGYTPATVIPVSKVCEKEHMPCLVHGNPVLSWLSEGPYEWSYLHFWPEPDLAEMYVDMWKQVDTNGRVGGLWNDDPDGKTFRAATIAAAKAQGFQFVGDEGFSPYGTEDYSDHVQNWIDNDVDIITGVFIPPDFANLRRQMDDMGYHPKMITVAKAILFPPAVEELGDDLAEGLTTEVWASKYYPIVSSLTNMTPEELADLWEAESGKQWTPPLYLSHAAFEMAIDVLERADSLNREDIRKAIEETDLTTTMGPVSFSRPLTDKEKERYAPWPELIENADHYSISPVTGGQWSRGKTWPWEINVVYNWQYEDIPETGALTPIPE